jgi:pantoate kinase
MREASAYAPGHITGLFQICDQPENPIRKGARGAGVSITQGTLTRVKIKSSNQFEYQIYINNNKMEHAIVSKTLLKKYEPMISRPHRIIVDHSIQTPITAGFGSSGGGALALSLALNEVLSLGLDVNEAAQLAHVAEIECGTGLGTVFAAMTGGFGVLYEPGAPGIGKSLTYESCNDYSVIYLYIGPIRTKNALLDPKLRERINLYGSSYVDELRKELTPEKFMKLSRSFSEHLGIITPRLRRFFNVTDENNYICTMAIFGEVLFSLTPKSNENRLIEILQSVEPLAEPIICGIDTKGARLIQE